MSFTVCPRMHLFEIDDQNWFPQYLRNRIQLILTWLWTKSFPLLQEDGPSASRTVAKVLKQTLGDTISSYAFIDFCAGAGGPTPVIERHVNRQLKTEGLPPVTFVLTDLWPNPEAWKIAARRSGGGVRFISEPVDAGKAPGKEVLLGAARGYEGESEKEEKKGEYGVGEEVEGRKVFRMFNLAFHHFDDEGAKRLLGDAMGSDAIGIFEIQSRTILGFLQVFMIGPLLTYFGPFHPPFWNFGHFFFTYIIPILPFVMVFDGYMSALRTRTPQEILKLIETIPEKEREGWEWTWGRRSFAKPVGEINYFIGVKK